MDALRGINYLLKSFQAQSAEELLKTFDCGRLTNTGLRLYYRFLCVKVALFHFQTENNFDALKKAEVEMNTLIDIGKEARITLRDPNYLQTQCFIQWKLAEYGETLTERVTARKLAWKLAHIGIEKYDLDCFYWLQAQLQDVI